MNACEFPVWQMSVDEVKALIETNRQQADRIAELEKQSEPVAWMEYIQGEEWEIWYVEPTDLPKGHTYKPLYLAPQTKPLSDEEHYKNKAEALDKRELELLAKIRSLEKINVDLSFRAVYAEKTLHMIERHYDQLDTQLHPQTKPLSDDEIDYLVDKCSDFTDDNDSLEFRYNDFARAIEERHGIK